MISTQFIHRSVVCGSRYAREHFNLSLVYHITISYIIQILQIPATMFGTLTYKIQNPQADILNPSFNNAELWKQRQSSLVTLKPSACMSRALKSNTHKCESQLYIFYLCV